MEYEKTSHNSNRLWLKRTEMPQNSTKLSMLFIALDSFSIWGGADKNESDLMSWEFPVGITKEVIEVALIRCGCKFSVLE